jgi:hypothetical protein
MMTGTLPAPARGAVLIEETSHRFDVARQALVVPQELGLRNESRVHRGDGVSVTQAIVLAFVAFLVAVPAPAVEVEGVGNAIYPERLVQSLDGNRQDVVVIVLIFPRRREAIPREEVNVHIEGRDVGRCSFAVLSGISLPHGLCFLGAA